MPSKRTKKSDSSIQQSTWTVVQRKFTNLVDSQSRFSVSQRRHTLFDYEGLGYTSLKLDSNLMNKLEGGEVQKLCPTCLSILQKQMKKDRPSFSKRRDLIRLLLFIQIPGQQKDQFYINPFNFQLHILVIGR